MSRTAIARIEIILSMVIFGSIGVFVKYINLPSSFISMCRGLIAFLFMLIACLIRKDKINFKTSAKNILLVIFSGAAMGANWVLLFESYKYTSVAVSTLFYYFAPVLVIIFSPIILKEKISIQKVICIIFILIGMVFTSGILTSNDKSSFNVLGLLLAFGAACLYASIILMNKKNQLGAYERTTGQMLVAGLVMIPYVFSTEKVSTLTFDTRSVILLLVVCIVHTGIAYILYFSGMVYLSAQTCGILSYIDPFVAVLCSMFILLEPFNAFTIIGAILIIGGAVVSEITFKKSLQEKNSCK